MGRLLEELRHTNTAGQCQGAQAGRPAGMWEERGPARDALVPGTALFCSLGSKHCTLSCPLTSHAAVPACPPLPPPHSRAHGAELHRGHRAPAVSHGALPRAPPAHRLWAARARPPPARPQPLAGQGPPAAARRSAAFHLAAGSACNMQYRRRHACGGSVCSSLDVSPYNPAPPRSADPPQAGDDREQQPAVGRPALVFWRRSA